MDKIGEPSNEKNLIVLLTSYTFSDIVIMLLDKLRKKENKR